MTHGEQRRWLIQQLLAEDPQYQNIQIPDDIQEQKNLLRALMNVRMPKKISKQFLDVQDEYLQAEIEAEGIIDVDDLKPFGSDPKIYLWQGDITRLKVDAIVNPANSKMLGCFQPLHNCADNIINTKAGIALRLEMNRIMTIQGHDEPTGEAKITSGFNLPAKHILHTVGPICYTGVPGTREKAQLASCYRSCYTLAADSGCKSIAFLCISTGVFMFPNKPAAEIAVKTVKECMAEDPRIEKVVFTVMKDLDRNYYENLLK
ncbi:protein-ADP-ribose hydrolase [Lactimicrobium massiliense]|uniref:protein-ADP-ribose hydrolase n=1 Tax=Lactimicrobium massiliense TaxID=2161814 RepID=UPI000D558A0F|nr:protein-ADP-ribose hydrolase [Lactimicrobium massiliense]